jgi:hypothetical protein
MPVDLAVLCRRTDPRGTVLFFGAGASCSSGAPTGGQLADALADHFKIDGKGLNLSDLSTIIEAQRGRRALVDALQGILLKIYPARGILNLPAYDWSAIYTTNFDKVVERSYGKYGKQIAVYSSNFDFTSLSTVADQKLYKIHGTIDQDQSHTLRPGLPF